jgi:O-antigen/teichoic acid export membrane protein
MYVLPTFILTDPSQMGIMFITGNIFSAVFIAGDFGLAQAFDKFVGEEYMKNPKKAIKYVQFFIWFQMFSGLIQTVGIALLGLYVIPKTLSMAFISYQFLLKAFIQWPGIGYLWTHALKAIQRADKEQVVNLITMILFDVIGMGAFSAIFLGIGNSDPTIGPVVGGAMGLTVAEVVKTFGLLVVSGMVFSKTDKRFRLLDMFRVDFDLELVKKTLLFGLKAMASTVIFLLGNFVVTIVIMFRLDNYTYWGTFIGSATLLLWPVTFMIVLYESQLPTVAESYTAGCNRLTEAYITYSWKYSGTFGLFIATAFLFFVGSFLTIILPDLYKPMGFFVGFYSVTKLIMALGDFSRLFLIAINKVEKYLLFVAIEQILRIIIFVSLIDRIPRPELLLIYGELPGVIFKVLATWFYTNKRVIPVKINIYQTIIAPAIASFVFLFVGLGFNSIYIRIIGKVDALIPTVIFTFLIFCVLFLTLYPFVLGLLGSWDADTLSQLRFAAETSGPSKRFAKLFYTSTVFGIKKSKLYGKHAIIIQGIEDDIDLLISLRNKAESEVEDN